MSIEPSSRSRRAVVGVLCAVWLAVTSGAAPARAERVRVGAETTVRSIRFEGVHGLPELRLRELLRTPARGKAWNLRVAVSKLPLVPAPRTQPFDPLVLQQDVVRLRNLYTAAGYLEARVRYDVTPVEGEDLIDIAMIVDEGSPVRVVDVTVGPSDLPVPADRIREWEAEVEHARGLTGKPCDTGLIEAGRSRMERWWRNAGFAMATVSSETVRDTVRDEAGVRYVVEPGRRWRFGGVSIHGNESISDNVVRRQLPFRRDDPYSRDVLRQAREDVQRLQIVRAARLEASPTGAGTTSVSDSTLAVRVTVLEASPRSIVGDVGYVTDAGLSTEVQWSHRNFTGAGRVLTLSGLVQTPWLAVNDKPDQRYRGGVSLQQPYVYDRRLSALVSPFVEYREDYSDRSLEYGSNFTLVYRARALLSGAVDYRIASRKIYEYRVGELLSGDVDLLTFLARLAQGERVGEGARIRSSLVTLSATAGQLDDLGNPRRGFLIRPSWQITAPTTLSSPSYTRADGSVFGYAPLPYGLTLAGRMTAGRLFPFGKSVPAPGEDPLVKSLALQEATFTAGGSTDVRGWSYRMLGPKYPDIRLREEGDSVSVSASGYVPRGGMARMSFSVELRAPLWPLGRNFGVHAFLDGGRVWNPDERFYFETPEFDQERMFYATGAGVDFITPVGSIRASVGYKLNPSLLDLADSEDVLRALLDGTSTDAIERHEGRRWQFNLAIGTSY